MNWLQRFWKQTTALAATLVMVSGAVIAYDEIRPWPTQSELYQVAGRSCKNEMTFYKQELRDIRRQIQAARDQKNVAWERTLREQEQQVLAEIDRVKRECGWS